MPICERLSVGHVNTPAGMEPVSVDLMASRPRYVVVSRGWLSSCTAEVLARPCHRRRFQHPARGTGQELTKADWPDAPATVVAGGSGCLARAAEPFVSGHAPSVRIGRGEVVVVKRRQVSVHATTAGVHAHPPTVRQDTINKTQSVAVGAVGAHVTHPPHRAAATRRRVMLHRREHSRRGCRPCR
jgi:hypothetical protein